MYQKRWAEADLERRSSAEIGEFETQLHRDFSLPILSPDNSVLVREIFAVHSRYTVFGFFVILQGLGERPGPCRYYVSLYGGILSRR